MFRYSALTFNSHRIHYDPLYCREIEELPDCIVHGPLTVTILLTWVYNNVIPSFSKTTGKSLKLKKYSYRNLLPLLVNRKITLAATDLRRDANSIDVWIQNEKGSVCVNGTMELESV